MNFASSYLLLICAVFLYTPSCAETLVVKLAGLHPKAGVVHVMIWKDAAGFPTRFEKAIAEKTQPVTGSEGEVVFTGIPRGSYAVAGYQDENGNGKMDRHFLGWPVEPTAASNGARGTMGPPSFSDAAFELKQTTQTIQLNFK